MTTTPKLSDLADSIIEGYWILCEPAEVVARAVYEFSEFRRLGRPFLYGDDQEATADDMIKALEEIINYYKGRNLWPVEGEAS